MGRPHVYNQRYSLPVGRADFEYVSTSKSTKRELDRASVRLASTVREEQHQAEAQRQAAMQDQQDRSQAASEVREKLALLGEHDFPGAVTVERVRLLSKLRTAWHFPRRDAMIPVEYELIPDGVNKLPSSSIKKGNLLITERTTGYPLGEAAKMLLQDGKVAQVAAYTNPAKGPLYTPFFGPEGQRLAGYSVIDPAEDFTPRGVIGVWDKFSFDLECYRSDYLQYTSGELDLVIGQFGLEATAEAAA